MTQAMIMVDKLDLADKIMRIATGVDHMNASDTYQIDVEYTDTFGGEANYCWVNRETLEIPHETSSREVMRRAKAAMGLTGMRGRSYSHGDMWEFRPYRHATVMFATVRY